MKRNYEIKDGIKAPFSSLIARVLGEVYIENGGFREGKRGNGVIYVGAGDESRNIDAIKAYIGGGVVKITGEGRYAEKMKLFYLVDETIATDAKRLANFRRVA